ncbi:hypothetical protein D3C81_2117200 [compost metagenome]
MGTPSARISLEHMALHVDAWRRSGLTRRQYALQHNIPFNRFRNWIQRTPTSATGTDLIPVRVVCPKHSEATVMLHLPGGIQLSCALATLAEVIRVVSHAQA